MSITTKKHSPICKAPSGFWQSLNSLFLLLSTTLFTPHSEEVMFFTWSWCVQLWNAFLVSMFFSAGCVSSYKWMVYNETNLFANYSLGHMDEAHCRKIQSGTHGRTACALPQTRISLAAIHQISLVVFCSTGGIAAVTGFRKKHCQRHNGPRA